MLYVQQSLTPGEELVYVGHFHWMYTVLAAINIFWGFIGCVGVMAGYIFFQARYGHGFESTGLLGMIRETHPGIRLGAFMVLVMGLLRFTHLMVTRSTTEIAVTTSRIIYKRGLVARFVGEMSIDRIEGVNVTQTIMGRILGYGRILIHGMGVGEVILPTLADPIGLRKAIEKARIS